MKIRFLGVHNIESDKAKLLSILIDDVLALDAGGLTSLLIDGREVSWAVVARGALGLVLIRAGILTLIGMAIFHRRELGRVAV